MSLESKREPDIALRQHTRVFARVSCEKLRVRHQMYIIIIIIIIMIIITHYVILTRVSCEELRASTPKQDTK